MYLPQWDYCIYVPRKVVLPLKNDISDIINWINPAVATNSRLYYDPWQSRPDVGDFVLNQNLNLVANDPEWLNKFDFSVPPPPTPNVVVQLPADQTDGQVCLRMPEPVTPSYELSPGTDPAVVFTVDQNGNCSLGPVFQQPTFPVYTTAPEAFPTVPITPLPYTSTVYNPVTPFTPLVTPVPGYDVIQYGGAGNGNLVQLTGNEGLFPCTPLPGNVYPYTPTAVNPGAGNVFQFPSPPGTPVGTPTFIPTQYFFGTSG